MQGQPSGDNGQPSQALKAAQQRAARQWRALGQRILAVSPRGIARFVLVFAAILSLVWLIRASWPATLPFVVGFAIAYMLLPVVTFLNRFMPRLFASLVATVGLAGALVLIPIVLIRPLVIELVRAYRALPEDTDVDDLTDWINERISGWPVPIQNFVRSELQETLISMRDRVDAFVSGLDGAVFQLLTGIIGAIGVVVGILVLPIWIHLVMKDQVAATGAINRRLPDWMEPDFWAIVRIFDRAFGRYIRGLALLGLAVGAASFAGLMTLEQLDIQEFRYPLAIAVAAGVFELVPTFGPIMSVLLFTGVGLSQGVDNAIVLFSMFVGIRYGIGKLLGPRLQHALVDIHPAILAVVLVALSQFGIFWTLLAAPITAVSRDLFRYVFGRLGDPPQPAGIAPGETATSNARKSGVARESLPLRRTALVYQRAQVPRATESPTLPDEATIEG
jgi:predicted PurR-regulated permease PerM